VVATTLIAVGILALLVFVLFTFLVELFRDVRQVRDALGILDRPLPVDIRPVAGTPPSRYGLPGQLDDEPFALLLFLTDKCVTCRVLASALGGTLPAGLWIVLEAATGQAAEEFREKFALAPGPGEERVFVDPEGAVAGRMGLKMTPVGYRIVNGVFTEATSVPSVRYLASILPTPAEGPVSV
jgi:hypothetical protein